MFDHEFGTVPSFVPVDQATVGAATASCHTKVSMEHQGAPFPLTGTALFETVQVVGRPVGVSLDTLSINFETHGRAPTTQKKVVFA